LSRGDCSQSGFAALRGSTAFGAAFGSEAQARRELAEVFFAVNPSRKLKSSRVQRFKGF